MQGTSPTRPTDPGRSATRPNSAGRKLTREEYIRNMKMKQKLQDAAAICDTDITQYSLIFEDVLKHQASDLIALENAVSRIQVSIQEEEYIVEQPLLDGCESVEDPVYLALLNLEFVAVDDTLYNEVVAITKAMSLEFHKGPPKKDERAMEKARLAYKGKYNLLKDLRRGSIVCPNIAMVCEVVECISNFSKSGLRVVRIKNRFDRKYNANRDSAGYRDLQFNILVPNTKLIWELQVHLKDIEDLKTKLRDQEDATGRTGHQRYVAFRTIRERIEQETPRIGHAESSPPKIAHTSVAEVSHTEASPRQVTDMSITHNGVAGKYTGPVNESNQANGKGVGCFDTGDYDGE